MTARALITLSYVLAIVTIGLIWWYLSPEMVNDMLDGGKYLASVVAGWVVHLVGFNDPYDYYTGFLTERALHNGRSLIVSVWMLAWLAAICFVVHHSHELMRMMRRSVVSIVVVHLAILALWLSLPWLMKPWYGFHEYAVKTFLRAGGWHRTQTLASLLQLHGLIVYGEVMFLYLWLTRQRHAHAAVAAAGRR